MRRVTGLAVTGKATALDQINARLSERLHPPELRDVEKSLAVWKHVEDEYL